MMILIVCYEERCNVKRGIERQNCAQAGQQRIAAKYDNLKQVKSDSPCIPAETQQTKEAGAL